MNRILKYTLYGAFVIVGTCATNFFGKKYFAILFDGQGWPFLLIGVFLSAFLLFLMAFGVDVIKDKREEGKKQKRISLYQNRRMRSEVLIERVSEFISVGTEKVNLIICNKDNADMPGLVLRRALCGLSKQEIPKELHLGGDLRYFLEAVTNLVGKNGFPTFLFIDMGQDSIKAGVPDILRTFKRHNLTAKIFISCSETYFEEKVTAFNELLDEKVVEKLVSDTIFKNGRRLQQLMQAIQNSLQ
ncbi:MAG: hypothetical protein KA052_01230 [Candidatus Pacebacteria bacterium]|nr:hypothetical protein [Candidatus Paceibacterota bacterium]